MNLIFFHPILSHRTVSLGVLSHWRTNAKLLGLAVFGCLAVVSSAAAQADVEFILDVSGSMEAKLNGESQIESARKSLLAAMNELDPKQQVALRAYGHRVSKNDKTASCKDTELLVPFKKLDKNEIAAKISNLTPRGWTPIAYALEECRNDLIDVGMGREVERVIILLTDGEETCGGDSIAVLKKLREEGFKLTVYTVGFNVNDVARKELKAIADFTGGKYFDARNAAELNRALTGAAKESATLIDKTRSTYGNAIRGGDGFETAVEIKPGTEYRLDHHQRKAQYDYFYMNLTRGTRVTMKIHTFERGIALSQDGGARENDNPYASIQAMGPTRDSIGKADIIGKRATEEIRSFVASADGRYYLSVGNVYSDQHKDQVTFQIDVETLGDADTAADAPDTIDGAIPIQPKRYGKNYIGDSDVIDTFSFNAAAGEKYIVGVIPNTPKSSQFRIRVVDEFKQELYDQSSGYDSGLKSQPIAIVEDGTYFIEITYKDETSIAYSLVVKKQGDAEGNPVETSGEPTKL